MSILFSPLKIGSMTIKNRFMRSPVNECMGNSDGTPKASLLKVIEKLAEGEVGLIIPGFVYTMESGKGGKRICALYNEEHANAWKSTINKVHQHGAKLVFQINHGGIGVLPELEKRSPVTFPGLSQGLKINEIEDIINSFVNSANIAKKAGADGVEIHAAHGYLYSLFLSPQINLRTDKYGKDLEGRARIVYETAESIKKTCGPDFAILIKMNGNDFLPNGITPELASRYVNHLKKHINMFEISCGVVNSLATIRPDSIRKLIPYTYGLKFNEAYNLPYAEIIKKNNPDTIIDDTNNYGNASSNNFPNPSSNCRRHSLNK